LEIQISFMKVRQMVDPLAEVVRLLQPDALRAKVVSGAGRWSVRRPRSDQPFYCVVMEGTPCLTVDGHDPLPLQAGDFVLVPSVHGFEMAGAPGPGASLEQGARPPADPKTTTFLPGEVRHGTPDGPPDVRLLAGHFTFGSPDAALLVTLLPKLIHIRGEPRLATLVQLASDEARALRPARAVILARLLEILMIEALRSTAGTAASPGLLRGLADARLAASIRRMHEDPGHPWTIETLAREAALSRSAFFERFRRALGLAPMEYLLSWRMALAKNLLRKGEVSITEIATRIGYASASSFTIAFTRHTGLPPARYARTLAAAPESAAAE
jgi:AraC-like DNA-binding protein